MTGGGPAMATSKINTLVSNIFGNSPSFNDIPNPMETLILPSSSHGLNEMVMEEENENMSFFVIESSQEQNSQQTVNNSGPNKRQNIGAARTNSKKQHMSMEGLQREVLELERSNAWRCVKLLKRAES
uniref:Uncharacterized protein n=1 Tax=Acrobeloides nanus TaxID=290746 RepID=A0A914CUQ5_9BILA